MLKYSIVQYSHKTDDCTQKHAITFICAMLFFPLSLSFFKYIQFSGEGRGIGTVSHLRGGDLTVEEGWD